MKKITRRLLPMTICLLTSAAAWADTTIAVHADQPVEPTTKCLSGVCLEDVNHEIYGGLYSQMIFGESFQEPPVAAPITGFKTYGGNWVVRDHAVEIDGGDGPKLVSEHAAFSDGSVEVEMQFADRSGENAGLLVRVSKPSVGADAFTGYEVSVDPVHQSVRLARHLGNYELIRDTPCDVPIGRWFTLQVKLAGSQIDLLADGKSVLRHDDGDAALKAGTVAVRAWHSKPSFRNLSVTIGGRSDALPFEQPVSPGDISSMWAPFVHGTATARFSLSPDHAFIGSQSQTMNFDSGDGDVGIENRGLNRWGMNFVADKPYEGYVWARAESAITLTASLENIDGSKVYAEQSLNVPAGDWQRLGLALLPSTNDRNGRFALKLKHPGSVALGHVFLQPGAWGRFKDLPVRRDVAEALVDQGPNVIRYGGSMVNSPGYRWKSMIGPRDRRPPYAGTWYQYSSNGWGVIDFLNFVEATGVTGIPDLNVNETPQDIADFIEYVNGPAESEWGRRRAADGHPAPYHLHYLELGNEERVDTAYADKFNALADVIWKKDADMILVVGDFSYTHKLTDPDHISGADSRITNLNGQRRVLDFAREHNREVWFDVHVWTDSLKPSSNLIALPSYIDAIDKLANRGKHKVVVFELNANSHGQNRALANALSINTIRRDNRIPIIASANALQPDGQNDNGWNQGLLFLNPWEVWLEPPGFVTRMQSRNRLPHLLKCELSERSHLDVTACRSEDGKTLILEVVNTGPAENTSIAFEGFTPRLATAEVTELASPSDTANTAEQPAQLRPNESRWHLAIEAGKMARLFPAHSFTILRFE